MEKLTQTILEEFLSWPGLYPPFCWYFKYIASLDTESNRVAQYFGECFFVTFELNF